MLGYIQDAYEEFHEQGDEANIEDIEAFLSAKGENIMAELRKESLEMAMDMVAAMGAETYARRICQPVSEVLLDFLQSNTAEMLYDKETNLWAEGPECTADEYEMEVAGMKQSGRCSMPRVPSMV